MTHTHTGHCTRIRMPLPMPLPSQQPRRCNVHSSERLEPDVAATSFRQKKYQRYSTILPYGISIRNSSYVADVPTAADSLSLYSCTVLPSSTARDQPASSPAAILNSAV